MPETVLILGARGRFGRHAAIAFKQAGWNVREFDRARDTLRQAAHGAAVIVNAWNPAYPDWADEVPRLTDAVLGAAKVTGATVIVPGNVYVFGAQTETPWSDASPHAATNPLGCVRIGMESAYRNSGVRTIILRAGDFIDTEPSGNWFDAVMTKKLARGRFVYPGNPEIPHAWAYLPDLARAAVQLAQRRAQLPEYSEICFPGYTLTGAEIAALLARATGSDIRLIRMKWWPVYLARPFWRVAKHLIEMRYLWNVPHCLAGDTFDRVLPDFRATRAEAAFAHAVMHLSVKPKIDPDKAMAAGR